MAETEAAYDRYGAAYRRWMAPIVAPPARRLIDRLDGAVVGDGKLRLVDIGTGTGTLAIEALARWSDASAIAIDQSKVMLDIAADEARQRGGTAIVDRLELRVGDAERLPIDDATADLAVSSFVIQLAASRAGAVREIFRVLRPGGTAAVVTWQIEEDPFEPDAVVDDVFEELRIDHPAGSGRARPYPSPAAAAAEFRRIGFEEVRATREWLQHQFTPQSYLDLVENWIEDDVFAELDEPRREKARSRILRQLGRLPAPALEWRLPLVSVIARRPGRRRPVGRTRAHMRLASASPFEALGPWAGFGAIRTGTTVGLGDDPEGQAHEDDERECRQNQNHRDRHAAILSVSVSTRHGSIVWGHGTAWSGCMPSEEPGRPVYEWSGRPVRSTDGSALFPLLGTPYRSRITIAWDLADDNSD